MDQKSKCKKYNYKTLREKPEWIFMIVGLAKDS